MSYKVILNPRFLRAGKSNGRKGMKTVFRTLCLVWLVLLGSRVEAATIIFNTSDSQFDAGVDNHGWWSATIINSDVNDNYFTDGGDHRSFFSFDLSTLNLLGQTVTSATLELVRYSYGGLDPSETLAFFDVSTPAATLNNNTGTNAAIVSDLSSGTSYGSFDVPAYTTSSTLTLSFALNAAALTDIAAAAGGFFSIGGTLLTSPPGVVFSSSQGSGIQRLIVETTPSATPVPEPTSLLLLGTGLVAAGVRRYRRRS